MPISVKVFPFGLLRSNVYLVFEEETGEALVIDAGGGTQYVLREVRKRDLKPKFILLTHGHFDHTFEVAEFRKVLGTDSYIHEKDLKVHETMWDLGLSAFGIKMPRPEVGRCFDDEPSFELGSHIVKVIHTPGHTPGSVCYFLPDERILFTGDTLFQGSIGRTDLPGGDPTAIRSSLRKLMSLGDETVVYPGHGGKTTIGVERRTNPFISRI